MEGEKKGGNGGSHHSDKKRERGSSFSSDGISLEELTIMKLMEEIMEYDQEIKMKQRWINTRMKMLHQLMPKQEKNDMKQIIHNFLLKLQPEYPKKITVNYDRGGEAIPMPMDSGEPIPLEMFKGEPIVLMTEDEFKHMHEEMDKKEAEAAT